AAVPAGSVHTPCQCASFLSHILAATTQKTARAEARQVSVPNVIPRFPRAQHCPYPSGLFNHAPQCGRFGYHARRCLCASQTTIVSRLAFSDNVVPEALRVVSQGFSSPRIYSWGD